MMLMGSNIVIYYKDLIHLRYTTTYKNGVESYGDLYTSKWFRETELYLVNERNIPNAYLLPLIFYWDSSNVAEIGNLNINTV